jgi:hypothetical protein
MLKRLSKSFLVVSCLTISSLTHAGEAKYPRDHMEFQDTETEAKVYELEKNIKEFTTEFGRKHLLVNDSEERLLEG